MWSVLTTASTNPIVELDFIGPDAHEMLGFPEQAKFAGLQTGELHYLKPSADGTPSVYPRPPISNASRHG